MVAVGAAVGEEIEERLRLTNREAGKLDEGAIPEHHAALDIGRSGLLDADADIGPQRAVFGLLAHVPRHGRTGAEVEVVGIEAVDPSLRRLGRAVAEGDTAAAHVVLALHS